MFLARNLVKLASTKAVSKVAVARTIPAVYVTQQRDQSSLKPETIAIVKSCVPLLEAGGEALIKHFYTILLKNDEVVPFFNAAHQKNGDQSRALARAVLGYAKNIDALQNIGPVASQIINKHVSLNIQAKHYPIVGTCLLQAIEEVLTPTVATPAVLEAWKEAYFHLADILIAAEEGIYAKNAAKEGGWRDEREFVLSKKVSESENGQIVSFYFTPKDGKPILSYEPGQFLGLYHKAADGKITRRNYSLSSSPNTNHYRITVKREDKGFFSSHLHNTMKEGDSLFFFPPSGDFTYKPNETKPLVLLAGGIGVTPLVSMLDKALATSQRPVTFIHSILSKEFQPFSSHFANLANQYPNRLTVRPYFNDKEGKLINKEILSKMLPVAGDTNNADKKKDVDVYFVGPTPFMKDMKKYCLELNVPANQIHYEFFGPAGVI
jgi:nitric oxide dioxygenase